MPKTIKYNAKVGSQFCQILYSYSRCGQIFCLSCKVTPDLVILQFWALTFCSVWYLDTFSFSCRACSSYDKCIRDSRLVHLGISAKILSRYSIKIWKIILNLQKVLDDVLWKFWPPCWSFLPGSEIEIIFWCRNGFINGKHSIEYCNVFWGPHG